MKRVKKSSGSWLDSMTGYMGSVTIFFQKIKEMDAEYKRWLTELKNKIGEYVVTPG
jgi:hypothetical protein